MDDSKMSRSDNGNCSPACYSLREPNMIKSISILEGDSADYVAQHKDQISCRDCSSVCRCCYLLPPSNNPNVSNLYSDIPQYLTFDFHKMNCRLKRTRPVALPKLSLNVTIILVILLLGLQTSCARTRYADVSSSAAGGRSRYRPDRLRRQDNRCEKIEIEMCKDIGYNQTNMALSPSHMFEQSDAASAVNQFRRLINTNCSEEMKWLVCSIYTPICMATYSEFLPPCRHICERAKKGCGPIMQRYQIKWPDLLNCDNFPPLAGNSPLCLHFNRSLQLRDDVTTVLPRNIDDVIPKIEPSALSSSSQPQTSVNSSKNLDEDKCRCSCHYPMVIIKDFDHPLYNKVTTGSVKNCAMSCKSPYFSDVKRKSIEKWITGWAIVCFVTTLFTVSTFLIDTERFKYPERPVIFLSVCYMFVSVGFLIRIVAGHEAVACTWKSDHVHYSTTGPFLCFIVFFLVYFFGMAGALWWVVLSITWFLAAALKWGSEAIANRWQYFHAIAWTLPIGQTIAILAKSSIDGDSLSGICYVGHQNKEKLTWFVIAPLFLYLVLGGAFLILGFSNLFHIRNSIKKVGKKTNSLETLMRRLGLFSLLYMIPSAALLASHLYEHQNSEEWAIRFNCRRERSGEPCSQTSTPKYAVFIVQYATTLFIGIANGVWILSKKTIVSWKKFYHRYRRNLCSPTGFFSWIRRRFVKNTANSDSSNFEVTRKSSDEEQESKNKDISSSSSSVHQADSSRGEYLIIRQQSTEESNKTSTLERTKISDRRKHNSSESRSRSSGSKYYCCHDDNQQITSFYVEPDSSSCLLPAPGTTNHVMMPLTAPNSCLVQSTGVLGAIPISNSRQNSSSRTKSSQSGNKASSSELENSPYFVYCDPSGTVTFLEHSSPILMDVEGGVERVQHIHHHHHHITPQVSCEHKEKSIRHNDPQKRSKLNSAHGPPSIFMIHGNTETQRKKTKMSSSSARSNSNRSNTNSSCQ